MRRALDHRVGRAGHRHLGIASGEMYPKIEKFFPPGRRLNDSLATCGEQALPVRFR
jgi:hypothetical protein